MRKYLTIVSVFSLFILNLCGEIVEVSRFDEIKSYVDKETLVLLDIDDTLLIPTQTLGTDVWFMDRLKNHAENGKSKEEALDKALAEWEAVRHLTNVKLVETTTDSVVRELQDHQIAVMGLTTQGLALATRTVNQLKSLSIDLVRTAPCEKEHFIFNEQSILYRRGILFTSGTPKGVALMKLLKKIDYHPKKIVFINDKKTHLMDVETTVLEHGIAFTGLRYNYSDDRVSHYNKQLADIQWKHSTFESIISDSAALELLKAQHALTDCGSD